MGNKKQLRLFQVKREREEREKDREIVGGRKREKKGRRNRSRKIEK